MKPILFNTEMVKAILEGRKTQTRRVIKPRPFHFSDCSRQKGLFDMGGNDWACCECGGDAMHNAPWAKGCKGVRSGYVVGDLLYVRETYLPINDVFYYKADDRHLELEKLRIKFKWRPSIHMPKEAARIFLRITGVRAERLCDISEEDSKAEGIKSYFMHKEHGGEWHESDGSFMGVRNTYPTRKKAFAELWNSTIKESDLDAYGWDANPWVWVYDFERVVPK